MKTIIFGGTTEGRLLAEALTKNGVSVTLIVATDYGRQMAQAVSEVYAKRLTREEMARYIKTGGFDRVIDATHPYAAEATQNISGACEDTGAEYIRLVRTDISTTHNAIKTNNGCLYVEDAREAAELLNKSEGNALIAAGSKALLDFTAVNNYKNRLYVRVIPMEESLRKAVLLGYKSSNIICMQGPFSKELNVATLKMINAEYLVTKESGKEGGFYEKLAAAETAGCKVIVIKRPKEEGFSFEQILRRYNIVCEKQPDTGGKPSESAFAHVAGFSFFPLFVNMKGKKVVIAGGGKIAARRAVKLADFGADVTVISPQADDAIVEYANKGIINYINRKYEKGDINGAFLAIGATNDKSANNAVLTDSKRFGALVITADNRETCDCYFPAIAENGKYAAGIVSKDGDHGGLARFAHKIRGVFNE